MMISFPYWKPPLHFTDPDIVITYYTIFDPTTPPTLPDDWQSKGSCLGLDPELFFPEQGDNRNVNRARKVCATCPVQQECKTYALLCGEKHGVWGGTTNVDRRIFVRGRPRWSKCVKCGKMRWRTAGGDSKCCNNYIKRWGES